MDDKKAIYLCIEFTLLYLLLPILLCAVGSRLGVFIALWGAGFYALATLRRSPGFSWHRLWHGQGWPLPQRRLAFLRFAALAVVLTWLSYALLPDKFMRFPLDRFSFWCAVMVLYPLLSVLPQELLFRSFYFARYRCFLTEGLAGILMSAILFGFSHIVLKNWIAPSFCGVAGLIIGQSYRQHRSLKWATIEHAFYGNWVFTVGIGWYFFMGNGR